MMDETQKTYTYKSKTDPYLVNIMACAVGVIIFGGLIVIQSSGLFDINALGMAQDHFMYLLYAFAGLFVLLLILAGLSFMRALNHKSSIVLTEKEIVVPEGSSGQTLTTVPLRNINKIYIENVKLDKVMLIKRRKEEHKIYESRMASDIQFSELNRYLNEYHEKAIGGSQ